MLSGCWMQEDDSDDAVAETPGIEYYGVPAELLTEDSSKAVSKSLLDDINGKVLYLARILPVNVDGNDVQANSIQLSTNGKKAFVSYNTAGATFRGAIQIVSIDSASILNGILRGTLGISKEYKFSNMDINSLYYDEDNDRLLFGACMDPDQSSDGSKTYLGYITVSNPESIDTVKSNMIPLNKITGADTIGSHGVSGITSTSNYYFISVGAGSGGIIRISRDLNLDNATYTPSFASYIDVRSILGYNDKVYALQGSDDGTDTGTLTGNGNILFSLNQGNTWETPSSIGSPINTADYRASFDLYKDATSNPNNLVFIGLSDHGMSIKNMNKSTGLLSDVPNTSHFDNPAVSGGLVANTNSVSFDEGLLFSANGNYGFRVFKNTGNLSSPDFEGVGYHKMQGDYYALSGNIQYSANDIAYRKRSLFVAAGQYGVCVYFYTGATK